LVATAGDVLSAEEISSLEKNGKQVKTRYDRAADQSEKLLRKLTTASDELRKYKYSLLI
jgi:phage shock protein A